MDLLDESKENIQPLKRGRNVGTLSTALQAQTDAEIHNQLMKEKKEYEILVRSYSGDDPLMPWYDYVQWVEQNFPKRGREGSLKVLLENCLSQFKDSEQYSQDVRYIDLWTRYISLCDNPLEMYKQIHARGIGTSCAIFYQCWAEEHECAGAVKRADQIYIEGIRRNAQPIEDLISAHTSFQVRIARNILGENPIEPREQPEERTALSMLRAHGRKKNMVDSKRVGNSIKHVTPGVLQPNCRVSLAHQRNNVQPQRISVYNDENDAVSDAVSNTKIKTVSLSSQCTNKENLQKPGRWNEGKFKKAFSSVGFTSASTTTRNPKFEVHIDENSEMPQTPRIDIVTSNVLKVRKYVYEDEKHIPVAIFEPPNPSVKAMYPKDKVYSGCSEFSLEELRAIIYLKRQKEIKKSSNEEDYLKNKVVRDEQPTEIPFIEHIQTVSHHDFQEHSRVENGSQFLSDNKEKGHFPSSKIEIYQEPEQKQSFEIFVEMKKDDGKLNEKKSFDNALRKEKKSIVPHTQFRKDLSFSGCLNFSTLVKGQKECVEQTPAQEIKKTQSFEQRDCDQSLTVNTKAVWNDVKGMWVSSPPASSKNSEGCNVRPSAPGPKSAQKSFTPFKIFSDISYVDSRQNCRMKEQKCTEYKVPIKTSSDQTAISQNPDFCNQQTASLNNAPRYRMSAQEHTLNLPENELQLCASDTEKQEIDPKRCVSIEDNFEVFFPPRDTTNSEHRTAQYYTPRGQMLDARDNNGHAPSIVVHVESEKSLNADPGIPFIPSPGLSHAQIVAMKGTEDKENMHARKNEGQSTQKKSKEILVPSKDHYYVPLEGQPVDEQENAFSDETCCTETFAKDLRISSTPLVHPYLKTVNKGNKIETSEDVDDTIAFMNPNTKRQFVVCENVPTLEKSLTIASTKKVYEMSENPADPTSAPFKTLASAHLSTILEVSDVRKGSSLGSADGGCTSKSSACDANQKQDNNEKCISGSNQDLLVQDLAELQEEFQLFRAASEQKLSRGRLSLKFISSRFRDDYLARNIFPSKFHQAHCIIIDKPLNFEINSPLQLGEKVYSITSKLSEKEGCQSFIAFESCSGEHKIIEIKLNSYLWEQYIGEEIRLRLVDSPKISHFVTTESIYIFMERHVVISPMLESASIKYILENGNYETALTESDILDIASDMMDIVSLLHHCKIVHGNLSVHTFMTRLDYTFLFLNDYRNAVDVSLLPPCTTFDVTEMPLYNTMNGRKLSPFQIDYIALADVFHHLIFNEPIKVYEERGLWQVSTLFPRNFNVNVWKTIFQNLLNNTEVDLTELSEWMKEQLPQMTCS